MRRWLRTITALCCVLLLASVLFLSGTCAWESNQQVRNDIYGSGTEKIPVILVKQEKTADGSVTGKVLPDTTFYLFQEDGVQIGGRYTTDENGEIHVALNPGNYYFEEITPALGYTYDLDENGEPITKYPFTVTDQESIVYVFANNIPLTGDLLIRKTVENADGTALSAFQLDAAFTFTVTFSDGGNYAYSIDGIPVGQLLSGGTLTLKHGQTASFHDLPTGLLYNVTEQTPLGYLVSGTGHQGNITEEQSVAEFINQIDLSNTCSLLISKRVEGAGANLDREYRFSLTVGDVTETFTLKHGETKTFSGFPLGSAYTVVEDDYAAEGYYAAVRSYSGTIADTETIELPFVNHYRPEPGSETGSLTITKQVQGIGADPDTEFVFTIEFSNEAVPQTFVLKAGESKTFWDIPLGTEYTVREETETLPDGYHAVMQEYSGTIVTAEQIVLPFVNGYNPDPVDQIGRLEITKTVIGENVSSDQTFEFCISFFGEDAPEGESFTLSAGETKTYYAPHGVIYLIEEINAGDCEAVLDKATGAFVGEVIATVEFINVVPDTEEPPKTGELVIRKEVSGEQADPDAMFGFSVEFYGEGAPSNDTFLLKAGMYKCYENIPQGVTYKVTETDAAGYEAVLTTAEGTIVAGEACDVLFTNIMQGEEPPAENIKLTVRKEVVGENTDLTKTFAMELIAGEWSEKFTLTAGETKQFLLPAGTVYEVREENYIADGYSQRIENGRGIATADILVVVTNTYVGEETIEISGTKTWDFSGCEDVALPESITVRLMNSDLLIEEQIVVPNEDDVWSYVFTAPKYNPDGTEAVYTVQELPIPGFRTSYDGYDILNTYIPPISVEFPIITKHVEGENIPETAFYFTLRGMPGAPMPDHADGYIARCFVIGEGQTSFGEILFSEPGDYTYLVYEANDGVSGWTYDAAIYTVTFTVTEDEDALSCEYTINRNYNFADKIEFTNIYEESNITETIIIRGEKIWNHGDNPIESRPKSVTILIYGNGELLHEIVVTEDDNWEYSIELPKYDENGNEILYCVDEVEIEDYEKIINGYIVINTYAPDDPTVPGDPDDPAVPGDPDEPDDPGDPDDPAVLDDPDDPDHPDHPDIPEDVPQTGDESNLPLWIGLLAISCVGLITTLLVGRKPRYKGKYLKRR